MENQPWKDKISNPAQLGGIETSILNDGAGRGTRVAWINTGTGLRYKVVIDRAMDIAEAFYNQHSLAWLSHLGITSPQPFSNTGTDWIKTFGGGLLATCGLDHVGSPESDNDGHRGLHGPISNIPAELLAINQPDPISGKMDMSITGRIKQSQPLGTQLELIRTLSGTLGKASITIHDEVINRGNTPAPHMLLYHFNFGWPMVDEGTEIVWQGEWQPKATGNSNKIFKEGNDFRKCPPPMEDHRGSGEEVVFINPIANESGECTCGLYNAQLGMALAVTFQKSQLPCLTNWQHWGKGEYVTGIEPGTNPPIGQKKAKENNELLFLQPGEKKEYDIELTVLTDVENIHDFLLTNKQ